MQVRSLVLAAAAALCATSAHAIKINDQAFVANGGDLGNVNGTAPNVFDALRAASTANQFHAVGRFGACTATWLGTEGDYAWVLTAARCVPNTNLVHAAENVFFENHAGIPLAGGAGSKSYVHPNRLATSTVGTDIAMVRLKLLPAAGTHAPKAAVVSDQTSEVGGKTSFVAHGHSLVGGAMVDAVMPANDRRAWGESIIDRTANTGTTLVSDYVAGSATHWAGMGVSDAGAGWWQSRDGAWQVVAVTSSGNHTQSLGTRVSTYAGWIKGLFPEAQLASTADTNPIVAAHVTESTTFTSGNFGYRTYFKVAPGQSGVVGPTSGVWGNGATGTTAVTVPVINVQTGETGSAVLRGRRNNGCTYWVPINDGVGCSGIATSLVHFSYAQAESALSSGQWRGRVVFDAHHIDSGAHRGQVALDIDITVPRITRTQQASLGSGSDAVATSIYFTVPAQSSATGPTAGHYNTSVGHSLITVNALNAVTQTLVPIKLRAQRENGCASLAMNNAQVCQGAQGKSTLKVWFNPADNPSLAAGRYHGSFEVLARGWHDKGFNVKTRLEFDIDMLP